MQPFVERRTGEERRTNWAQAVEARGAHFARRQVLDDLSLLLGRWSIEGRCPNEEIQALIAKYRAL